MIDDSDLLRSYLKEGSQEAFTALVNRHLNFVYATALRMTGARHRAQDVTQNVFTDLCRKACHLADRRNLVGWLYISTQMSAMKLAREESRRERREHNAAALESSTSGPNSAVDWSRVAPVLDAVLARLPSRDREAILLRFFKSASFAEVGLVLNTSENSARMRVSRAMEKARKHLGERGVVSTAAALELVLSSQAAMAVAPLSAGGISGMALATASAGSSSIISIFLLGIMSTSKIITGAAALAAIIAIGTAIHEHNGRQRAEAQVANLTKDSDALQEKWRTDEELLARLKAGSARPQQSLSPSFQSAADKLRAKANLGLPSLSDPANSEQIASYHKRYDAFFRQRGLTPDQVDRVIQIWIEWDNLHADLQAAVRKQGLSDESTGSPIEALRSQLFQPLVGDLISVLGEDGYAAYNEYQKSSFWAAILQPITDGLTASNLSLTDQQASRLESIVQANNHPIHEHPTDISSKIAIDWDAVVVESNGVLTPDQMAILQARIQALKKSP